MTEDIDEKSIPDGYHSITPYLVIRNASKAIEFYKNAFGAKEIYRINGPDGISIGHAELNIGDSIFMLSDEYPEMKWFSPESIGGSPVSMYVYVKDVDRIFNQAISQGATAIKPVEDQFYGDRSGFLKDPFGHFWSIATRKQNLSIEEVKKKGEEKMLEMLNKKIKNDNIPSSL